MTSIPHRVFWVARLIVAAGLISQSGATFASMPEDQGFFEQLAEGVYVHRGQHAGIDDPARADSANIGFIAGTDCVAVIDTGGALRTGKLLRNAITALTDTPICYVINTHVHFDHVLGNAAFLQDKPEFVGHRNLAEAMDGNKEFFVEQFPEELDHQDTSMVIGPTRLVDAEEVIDLGGRELVLRAASPAHTSADLTVYDKQSNLLWSGDLVFRERMPILDASLRGWLKWLEADYQSVKVVPGHGPAGDDWQTSTVQLRQYLKALLDETRRAIADGMFLEDALDSVAVEAAQSWQLNDRHARNVSRAFRELEWE